MSTIKIKCVDQVLAFTNTPVITTGDQNIDKIKIDFCPLWDGFVKVGVFFQQKGEFSYAVINADGSCPIPNSICNCQGKIYFAVSGTNSKNQVRTSNIVCYTIEEGVADAHIQDEFPGEITDEEKEDIYNKMLELVTEMQTLTQDLIKNFAYVRIKDGNEFSYGVDQLQAQIRAYTYAKAVIDQKISALNLAINATNGSLNNLSNTVTNNTSRINANASNISSLSDEIVSLSNDIGSLNDSISSLSRTISTLDDTTLKLVDYRQDQLAFAEWRETIEARLEALGG